MDLRVSVTRIADIVNEKRAITVDTALRFARYFNNSPTFWMNLQRAMTWKSPKMRLPIRLNAMSALWSKVVHQSDPDLGCALQGKEKAFSEAEAP